MKTLILNFVLRYIRSHVGHVNSDVRASMFTALSQGLALEFNEDNLHNRTYDFVKWFAENDPDFKSMYVVNPSTIKMLAHNAAEGLIDGVVATNR